MFDKNIHMAKPLSVVIKKSNKSEKKLMAIFKMDNGRTKTGTTPHQQELFRDGYCGICRLVRHLLLLLKGNLNCKSNFNLFEYK